MFLSGDAASSSFYSGLSLSVSLHLVSHLLQSAHDRVQDLATSCNPKREDTMVAQSSASVGTFETPGVEKETGSPPLCHSSPQEIDTSIPLPSFSLELGGVLDRLAVLLPAVRLWLEWMVAQVEIWTSVTSLPTLVPM